jgi:hypothetical protein
MPGAVRIAFDAPVDRAAWDRFCRANGIAHAFRMKGGGDVFRRGVVQVAVWGDDGAATPAPAGGGPVRGAIVQAFGAGDPGAVAAVARAVLQAFPASLEPPGGRAPPPPLVRPRPLPRPRPPAPAFAAVPTTAGEAAVLLSAEDRAALLWLPADGSVRGRRGGVLPAEPAEAALERLSDWTVGDPRRAVSARLCLCVRERGREAVAGAGELWRLTPLGAAVRGALEGAKGAAADSADDAEVP